MNQLTRYIAFQVLMGILLVSVIFIVLIGLIDFVELSRTVGTADGVEISDLGFLALMRMPSLMETTFPFVMLFGAMWSIARLNRRSELIAMRAGGMSAWAFLRPVFFMALTLGILSATLFNPGAASLYAQAEKRSAFLQNEQYRQIAISETGVWLREASEDSQTVIRAAEARDGGRELIDLTVYIYDRLQDGTPDFVRRLDASRAKLIGGFWQFDDVVESEPEKAPLLHSSLALETRLEPNRLIERGGGPRSMTFWQLPDYATQLERAGFAARDYWLSWWKLLVTPLVLAAMGTIGVAVSMSLTRSGGNALLAIVGIATGFGVYLADNLVGAFASTGITPAFVSAFTAPLIALLGGLYAIAVLEDG
jgi:lipopolysaccharide export system permease protein